MRSDIVRAGVFIGVDHSGNLQPLKDAAAGARRMYDWALHQGVVDGRQAQLITDEDGRKVDPGQIYDAITEIVDGPGADQLIVYFAGHGVNLNRSEHWLLSDAPRQTGAAVNVAGSVELARYCGIGHVAMISDSCRVAPAGIQAQNVRGQDVFPSDGGGSRAHPVDQFFACRLGRAAGEIQDAREAATGFTAVYTAAMLDALYGFRDEVFDHRTDPVDGARFVVPHLLQAYLEREIPARLRARGLRQVFNQEPDALLMRHDYWLARVVPTAAEPLRGPETPRPPRRAVTLRDVAGRLVSAAAHQSEAELRQEIWKAEQRPDIGTDSLAARVRRTAAPFGPDHDESGCGIKIRGAQLVECFAYGVQCETLGKDGDLVRVHDPDGRLPASVILRFASGVGTVVPVFTGFLTAITFDGPELVDVAFEPSANHRRWAAFVGLADRVRVVRAVTGAVAQYDRLDLDSTTAAHLLDRARYGDTVDLGVALRVAYAHHDRQEPLGEIQRLAALQRGQLGACCSTSHWSGASWSAGRLGPSPASCRSFR
ncbi:hypothetical protein GCM10027610_081020 [Dactylosporangium cerinum]